MQYFFWSELLSVCERNEKEIGKKNPKPQQTKPNRTKPNQKLKGRFLFFLHF